MDMIMILRAFLVGCKGVCTLWDETGLYRKNG